MNIYSDLDLEKYEGSYFSIDRFEENFAVCENKITSEIINISKKLLPDSAKTGDILKIENKKLIIDYENTKKEQQEIKTLVDNLFKRKQ